MKLALIFVTGIFAVLGLFAFSADAATVPPGAYYTDVIGGGIGSAPAGYFRNDDEFFGPYSLSFTLTYFSTTYTTYFISNNGVISFGVGVSEFTPTATLDQQTLAPMIAPYWADVDTRPSNGGTVTVRNDIANQIIVTWDQVGYYNQHTDLLASLQMVLRGPDYAVPADEGDIGFFFKSVQWETGDASGGSGGFGGTEASVGFGDGQAAVNPGEVSIPGSREAGISLIVSNRHFWFNLGEGGIPEPPPDLSVPEPGTLALFVTGLLSLCLVSPRLRERKA